METVPGIAIDPAVRFGKPCVVGTRVDVATVVWALEGSGSFEEVEREYALTREQIRAALSHAARTVDLSDRMQT
jgi:uncharacterized protein (DUF433 family)